MIDRLKNHNRWTRAHTLWLIVIIVLAAGAAMLSSCGAAVDAAGKVSDMVPSREGTRSYDDYLSLAADVDVAAKDQSAFQATSRAFCDGPTVDYATLLDDVADDGVVTQTLKDRAVVVYVSCPERGELLDAQVQEKTGINAHVMDIVRIADKTARVRNG